MRQGLRFAQELDDISLDDLVMEHIDSRPSR